MKNDHAVFQTRFDNFNVYKCLIRKKIPKKKYFEKSIDKYLKKKNMLRNVYPVTVAYAGTASILASTTVCNTIGMVTIYVPSL